MLVQSMNVSKTTDGKISGKFVKGFLTLLGLGLIGIYILKKVKDKKQIKE
jgi:hypothetical protein